MSTIRERDAADMTPGGMQRVWRYSVEDLESGEFVEAVPVDCYADRRALLVALDAQAEAADRAVFLLANYLWDKDGDDEDWLIEAQDALRAALAALKEATDG